MSRHIAELVNAIPGVEEMSLLELGTREGLNFERFACKRKDSVDIRYDPTFRMTTDAFFEQNDGRLTYDIVFIDADHHAAQVMKDFNNAITIAKRAVFIHDLFPNRAGYATENGSQAGDGYRLMPEFFLQPMFPFVLNTDHGLTMILPPFFPLLGYRKDLTYVEMVEWWGTRKRYSVEEMKEVIKRRKW